MLPGSFSRKPTWIRLPGLVGVVVIGLPRGSSELEPLHKTGITVLIGAGAYILEMSNESLAKAWLEIDKVQGPQAAVYFAADNRARRRMIRVLR
jgi:hypothetical protein